MSCNAFIFARGGSRGLWRKNLQLCGGVPLVVHAVKCAQASGVAQNVYVSTDDEEIARLAYSCGAEVIERPAALATGQTPNGEWDSWQHAVASVAPADWFVSVPPTCPLRIPQDIERTLHAIKASPKHHAAVTVTKARDNPYYTACIIKDNRLMPLFPKQRALRRQEAPEAWVVAGVCYSMRSGFVMKNTGLWNGHLLPVPVPNERAIDIDTQHDLDIADALMRKASDFYKVDTPLSEPIADQ